MIRTRFRLRTILDVGALLAGASSLAADEFLIITPGSFAAGTIRDETGLIVGSVTPGSGDRVYIRDRSGLIVGSIAPGIGDRAYVRDRSGRIVGTLDAETSGGVLIVPAD